MTFAPKEGGTTQFTPSSKRNACPICGRVKDGDCRISPGLILCHKKTDHKVGELINGWAFTGVSKDGRTGKFTPHKPLEKHPETFYGYSETQRIKRYYKEGKNAFLLSTCRQEIGGQGPALILGPCSLRTRLCVVWQN